MHPPTILPLVLGCVAVAALGLFSARLRRAGIDPWVLSRGDDAPGFLGRVFAALVLAYALILAGWAFAPGWSLAWLGGVAALQGTATAWLGTALIAAGVGLVVLGQAAMGLAWRVGIAPDERPKLVTGSVFRWSRNPIFLGMLAAAAGVALAIPHALSLAALAATHVALSVQIRLEEAHLRAQLGEAYVAYLRRVGRWIGPGGRPIG